MTMEFPTIDKFAKEVAEKALDEITYEGKTVRERAEIIVNQHPSEDCISRKAVTDTSICEGISCNECSFNTCEDGQSGCLLKERVDKLPSVTPRTNLAETSQDCISRQAVIGYITANYGFCHNLIDEIKAMPPVTPERPKGKWIKIPITLCHYPCDGCVKDKSRADDAWCSSCKFWKAEDFDYRCSECGKIYSEVENYCPNCGAEMVEPQESEG